MGEAEPYPSGQPFVLGSSGRRYSDALKGTSSYINKKYDTNMKLLANIFLSGLAILACVSCSKDEDPVLPLEGAKLSVAVKASGTATKAYNPNDVNELEDSMGVEYPLEIHRINKFIQIHLKRL